MLHKILASLLFILSTSLVSIVRFFFPFAKCPIPINWILDQIINGKIAFWPSCLSFLAFLPSLVKVNLESSEVFVYWIFFQLIVCIKSWNWFKFTFHSAGVSASILLYLNQIEYWKLKKMWAEYENEKLRQNEQKYVHTLCIQCFAGRTAHALQFHI